MMRRYWQDFVYLVLGLGLLLWVASDAFGLRLITYSPGADYWEHTAVLRALLEDPWHPTHPLIVSTAGSPRFGPHFLLIALVGRAFSLGPLDTMGLAAVVNTALLLVGIWWFCRSYFRDLRASLYGLVVFFCTWFDAPHFSNVFKLKVFFSVAGYPSSAALALTLIGLALVTKIVRGELTRPLWLGLSALVWGYVYVTHPLTATMGLPAAVLLALSEPAVPTKRRLAVAGSVVIGLLLTALWPYYPALGMVAGGTVERVKDAVPEDLGGAHRFYGLSDLTDILGFCWLAFPLLPYLWVRRQHVFIVLGALLMLGVFVGNVLLPLPLGHRYILLSVFFLQLALVKLLLILTPRRGTSAWAERAPLRWAAAGLVGVFLSYALGSNIQVAEEHLRRTAGQGRGKEERESLPLRYARRVGELAGPHAVILSSALASWPLPTFGPKVVAPHHTNPLIPDAQERRRAAIRFLAPHTSANERRLILQRYRVTHVVTPPRASSAVLDFLDREGKRTGLPGGFALYTLKPRN
jgi:hypothetical protein